MSRFNRTATTESVSFKLSELPRSCVSSNSIWTSCRAAAMEESGSKSSPYRDFFAFQSGRVARASPLFMVRAHDRNHRIRKLYALQNFCSHDRVDLDLLELLGREFPRLGDNLLGHGQLADVVQQS